MQRGLRKILSLGVVVAFAGLPACQDGDGQLDELVAAQEAAVAELEEAKKTLDAKREELAQIEARLKAPEEPEAEAEAGAGAEGEEAEEPFDPEAAKQRAEVLKSEIESAADELVGSIVGFINDDPPTAGEPLNDRQRRAVEMKIDEDIHLAHDFIDRGGDYKRALNILEGMLPLAPDHARLNEEIARANELRFMSEERFEGVKKGMTEEEVRAVLGPVNLRNIRPYEEKGVTAWFYPKDGGGAAGVWFQERKGELVTYKMDFNAIKVDDPEGT